MSLNRIIAPVVKPIDRMEIPPLEELKLSNGVPVYVLNQGDQDVSRLDIMVDASKWQQPKSLVSTFTNQLLKEGAGTFTSGEIAERLDYYGAWLQLSESFHYSYLTLYTLNKYFEETVHLLELMFRQPHFSEKEFCTMQERHRQQFLIDNDKVQVLATQGFSSQLFGPEHPYGQTVVLADFDRLHTDDLKDFHRRYYRIGNVRLILSGKITDRQLKQMENCFGTERVITSDTPDDANVQPHFPGSASAEKRCFIEKPGALQNGIRMGLPVVNRSHPDFPGLWVLNTVFGGYFGSRLMSNIREEKGYTYGIFSGITSQKYAAYLSVATQTACEHTENLIREVYTEIDRLQNECVGMQELDMLRNYMLGDFARSLDGTFSLIEAYISLLASGMDVSFFQKQIETVKSIVPEEIRRLAQQYLVKENMLETVAGSFPQ